MCRRHSQPFCLVSSSMPPAYQHCLSENAKWVGGGGSRKCKTYFGGLSSTGGVRIIPPSVVSSANACASSSLLSTLPAFRRLRSNNSRSWSSSWTRFFFCPLAVCALAMCRSGRTRVKKEVLEGGIGGWCGMLQAGVGAGFRFCIWLG